MENKNNESGFNVAAICFNAPGRSFVQCKDRQLIMASRKFGAIGSNSSLHPTLVAWLIASLIIFSEISAWINLGVFCSLGQIFQTFHPWHLYLKQAQSFCLDLLACQLTVPARFLGEN